MKCGAASRIAVVLLGCCWHAPASADEASLLLGNVPITSAVRKVIDATPAAAAPAAAGPRLSGDSVDVDDDLPAAEIPALGKLRLQELRLKGAGSASGAAAGQLGATLLELHGGRLEAHATSNLTESIAAKLAPLAVSASMPALHKISIDDEGASAGTPAVKPSGFHVLDVVRHMQDPAPGIPGAAPDGVVDVLRRIQAGASVDVTTPASRKIPDTPLDRLKEAQVQLAELAKLLPPGQPGIIDNINKVIAPQAIADLSVKLKTDNGQSADILAKITALSLNADTDAEISPPPGLPPDPSADLPTIDTTIKALDRLLKIDAGAAPKAGNVDATIARLKERLADADEIDSPQWAALVIKLEELGEKHIPPQVLRDLEDLLKAPDTATPDVSPSLPERRIPTAAIIKTLEAIEAPATPGVAPPRSRIDVALGDAGSKVQASISGALTEVAGKINAGLDKAFSALKDTCISEGDVHAKSAASLATQAASVKVPPIEYEDCHCRRCGDCLWTSECCCASCPIASTVKANADASAKKSSLEAQAKAEKDTADKLYGAADKVILQKNEIEANLASIFSGTKVQIGQIDLSGASADEGDEESSSSAQSRREPPHPHGSSLVDNHSMLDRFLAISGESIRTLQISESVNAAVGANAYAEQALASIAEGRGRKNFGSINDIDVSVGAVNAAIGYNTYARQMVAAIGATDANEDVDAIAAKRIVSAPINAAIGGNTLADMRIASIDGSAGHRLSMDSLVSAPVNAAVGHGSTALMEVGNIDGSIRGQANSTVVSTAPISAAIGGQSTSTVRIGNLDEDATVGGSYDSKVVQPAGTVSVSLGHNTTSLVGLGNLDGSVGGNASVAVNTGPVVSASIGSSSTAINRVGELAENTRVGGRLALSANTGLLTAFALGAGTSARNEVAVIDAPVSGSASIRVSAGEIVTGTVGANTAANAMLGSIKAPVYGNADISVNAGGVNTFSIGLSNDRTINSQTFIGNVLQPVTGSAKINVNTGGVFTLGFGLIITIPVIGTLDFSRQGCTNIGNIGSGC